MDEAVSAGEIQRRRKEAQSIAFFLLAPVKQAEIGETIARYFTKCFRLL